jgi:protoheme IX farnesyltransferase
MSGLIYLAGAAVLDGIFLYYALRIYLNYSDEIAKKAFRYSIVYLAALFVVLLVDHYIRF